MAACVTCGEKAGIGKVVCSSCDEEHKRFEEQERAKRAREVQERVRKRVEVRAEKVAEDTNTFVAACMTQIEDAHRLGLSPSLLATHPMSTTFSVSGRRAGQPPEIAGFLADVTLGWEVISTIPHTEGISLSNKTGTGNSVYAGGIGGIVTSVYVLMRLPITPEFLREKRSYIESFLRAHYQDGVSVIPSGSSFSADSKQSSSGSTMRNTAAGTAAAGFFTASTVIGVDGLTGGHSDSEVGDSGDADFGDFSF